MSFNDVFGTGLTDENIAAIVASVVGGVTSGVGDSYLPTSAIIKHITRGDSYDGTANPKLSWVVSKDYQSGWVGTFTIRHRLTDAVLLTSSVTVVSGTELSVSLDTNDTSFALLSSAEEFGPHPYDIQMVNSTAEITAVPNGIAVITKDRTTA